VHTGTLLPQRQIFKLIQEPQKRKNAKTQKRKNAKTAEFFFIIQSKEIERE
jgi:hypothetical protein